MKLGPDKVPVEPLADDRVVNLERRIVAQAGDRLARPLRARRPWVAYGAAAAAVAAAFVVGWKVKRGPAAPADAPSVAAGDPTATVRVRTDALGSMLDLGDATIASAPDTVFAVTRPAGGVLVDMQRGRVELAVGKRGAQPPLVVRAGDTDVIVVGTKFSVDYHDGTGDPDVRVTEGVVRVVKRAQHLEVKVAAGHAWRATTGVTEVIAAGDAPAPPIEIDGSGGAPVLRDHVAAVPDAHLPVPPPRASGPTALAGGPEVSHRPTGFTPPPDPHGALAREIAKLALPAPRAVDAPDAAGAVAKYYEMLRRRESPEDESAAMYGIAYTNTIKLGRSRETMIDGYRARFSAKHYAEWDAMLWIDVRSHCVSASATDAECREALRTYLRDSSPDAPGRTIAHLGAD